MYNKSYDEYYHGIYDGALSESLQKHILPAFEYIESLNKKKIRILDICFGLGYNTLATLYIIEQHYKDIEVEIYTPELDKDLVKKLLDFPYPVELQKYRNIIEMLNKDHFFSGEKVQISLYLGDARDYIKRFENFFDIVYQDPFSFKKNPSLWSFEYFRDIKKSSKEDAILTTYSSATIVRLAMYLNGYTLYEKKNENSRGGTFGFLNRDYFKKLEKVEFEKKLKKSSIKNPIFDKNIEKC